jgi:hypothetical protein
MRVGMTEGLVSILTSDERKHCTCEAEHQKFVLPGARGRIDHPLRACNGFVEPGSPLIELDAVICLLRGARLYLLVVLASAPCE